MAKQETVLCVFICRLSILIFKFISFKATIKLKIFPVKMANSVLSAYKRSEDNIIRDDVYAYFFCGLNFDFLIHVISFVFVSGSTVVCLVTA